MIIHFKANSNYTPESLTLFAYSIEVIAIPRGLEATISSQENFPSDKLEYTNVAILGPNVMYVTNSPRQLCLNLNPVE